MRTGVVAAVALVGGLLTASPAEAAVVTAAPASLTAAQPAAQPVAQTAAAARPGNGKVLYDRISGGRSHFKVKNGGTRDGVVTLVRGKTKAFSIYVRGKSTATFKSVRDGTYTIYFTTGYRFSTSKGRFTRSPAYQRFNRKLKFVTTAAGATIWTVTITPVRGGNASTSAINPKDFPA